MAIFAPKQWANPFGKMSIFRLFQLFLFIAQKGVFLVLEYRKRHISWPTLPKKKEVAKMAIFGPKPWVNPFGKILISRLFKVLVFIALKSVSSIQNIVKDTFPTYIAQKKKLEKWPFLCPQPWVNLFGKMSIFQLLELLVFIPQKRVFSFQNIVKHIFLAYIA